MGKKKSASPPSKGAGRHGSVKSKPSSSKTPSPKTPSPKAEAMANSTSGGGDAVMAQAVHTVLHPEPWLEPVSDPPLEAAMAGPPRGPREPRPVRPAPSSSEPPPVAPGAEATLAPAAMQVPDLEALSRNMTRLVEESGKLAATMAGSEPRRPAFQVDLADAVQTLGQVAEHWFGDPARLFQAQATLAAGVLDLWATSTSRLSAGARPDEASPPADKRFTDPEWRNNPVFDVLHKAFLFGSQWANGLVEKADGLDDATKEKARFYLRQITSAISPSNFVPTNPELLRETLQENGGNLLRGFKMLSEDLAAGNGQLRIRHTDTSKFGLGVNMAMTPGKVVYRNELIELLQYAPSTPQVLKRPLLIVPPWINKFYVLDLNPEKSFIKWAVAQGLTVFVISWVNPDERHAAKDFEAYMREGILASLEAVEVATGERDVATIGYCVGGTLLAVTLAHMVARADQRISSATLFTAQVDFTHAGDLKVFADESQIRALESEMKERGYLRGAQMAQAFNMLRPDDLIWSYWVNNYLRGKEPPAFDLLAWNSDSTRMPAANHSFYLRNCYLENNLARGLMEIGGAMLDLKRITVPIYNLATREDHIAPALSVFEGSKCFGGPVRYVLSGSGHVAGVVNPPSKVKYGYTVGPPPAGSFEDWLSSATERPGSWWPDWMAWIKAQAPALVGSRVPGGGRGTLGDAPGDYVRVRA